VCLRFAYVLAVRIVAALRLWRCGDDHKTIEILLPRHRLAVLQRQLAATGKRPQPDWADRAIIALLLGLVPKTRRAGLRLFVTPDTILRWHRDLLPAPLGEEVLPEERPPGHAPEHQDLVLRLARQNPARGVTGGSTASWPALASPSPPPPSGRSSRPPASSLRHDAAR
jgi:hypothetical protein